MHGCRTKLISTSVAKRTNFSGVSSGLLIVLSQDDVSGSATFAQHALNDR